jgi:hypothetical protein
VFLAAGGGAGRRGAANWRDGLLRGVGFAAYLERILVAPGSKPGANLKLEISKEVEKMVRSPRMASLQVWARERV